MAVKGLKIREDLSGEVEENKFKVVIEGPDMASCESYQAGQMARKFARSNWDRSARQSYLDSRAPRREESGVRTDGEVWLREIGYIPYITD